MEDETTVYNISGTYLIRIPAKMAKFFKLSSKHTAKIKDISKTEANIKF